ncbi:MAG: hypothetical protein M8353_09245 [ANME-2 cluster archaeon]|nr:hypothetical protein [ANME-2 cluster archaeon]
MKNKILIVLILLALMHPVSAIDPIITIRVPVQEEPAEGFFVYPEGTTFEQGQSILFRNDDKNRRWFTVICDKNIFDNGSSNEAYMSYRQITPVQLSEPGIFNFHLKEKPTVNIQITVIGDGTAPEVQETQDSPVDLPEKDELFPGLGELPAPGMLPAFMLLILAFLTLRTKR